MPISYRCVGLIYDCMSYTLGPLTNAGSSYRFVGRTYICMSYSFCSLMHVLQFVVLLMSVCLTNGYVLQFCGILFMFCWPNAKELGVYLK